MKPISAKSRSRLKIAYYILCPILCPIIFLMTLVFSFVTTVARDEGKRVQISDDFCRMHVAFIYYIHKAFVDDINLSLKEGQRPAELTTDFMKAQSSALFGANGIDNMAVNMVMPRQYESRIELLKNEIRSLFNLEADIFPLEENEKKTARIIKRRSYIENLDKGG